MGKSTPAAGGHDVRRFPGRMPAPSPAMPRMSGPVGDDCFAAAVEERLARQAPLAARLRPRSLGDIGGRDELVG